jgi:hypothetical protein
MGADVPAVKDKVQRYLVELFGGVQVDRDGDFTVRHGSTQVFVSVRPFHEANTAVKVFAPINFDVPASAELFHYVATRGSYPFGHLRCSEQDGKVVVTFGHTLLGEFLDPDELKVALFTVAGLGDGLDDEIKAKFGGRLFHEEAPGDPAS